MAKTLQSAAEGLYEDERLRSNLTDAEAKQVLDWAVKMLETRASAASSGANTPKLVDPADLDRVRQVLVAINASASAPGTLSLGGAVGPVVSVLAGTRPFTRQEVLTLLTALAKAAFEMRTGNK